MQLQNLDVHIILIYYYAVYIIIQSIMFFMFTSLKVTFLPFQTAVFTNTKQYIGHQL